MPLVMKVLAPLITQPSPSRLPRVEIAARSEPVPGSVIATASTFSPEAIPGSQRARCSSLAEAMMYGSTTSEWSSGPAIASETPAQTEASARTTLNRQSSTSGPPNSSGTSIARNPYSAHFVKRSLGTR